MVPAIHRPAEVKVNLRAIKDNLKAELAHLKPGQKLFAVVKANAYGHGAVKVAKLAARSGASGFCVATLDEAIELRDASIVEPILVLGITPANEALLAAAHNISLAAPSLEWLESAQKALANKNQVLKIHLAIDSGMGRIGFSEDHEFIAANKLLKDNPNFFVEGMFAHFASADSSDESYFNYQVKRFNHLKELLTVKPKWIHIANTAASIFDKDIKSDIVRFGIGLYGLNPSSNPDSADLASHIELKPALSVESELSFVKQIHAGYGVGYGSEFVADGDQWIGTVPVGYADGIIRALSGFKVKVGSDFCPIVGRICMDQFMVLLPEKKPVGTKVVIYSDQEADSNFIKKAADYTNTIHYELACLLSDRLPRTYHE